MENSTVTLKWVVQLTATKKAPESSVAADEIGVSKRESDILNFAILLQLTVRAGVCVSVQVLKSERDVVSTLKCYVAPPGLPWNCL
jgi:hypothetical protein